MLDLKYIKEHLDQVKANCKNRLVNIDIDRLVLLDKQRREAETKLDGLRAQRNKASKNKPTPEIIAEMKMIGAEISKLENEIKKIEPELKTLWYAVPNLTHPEVKISVNEDDNPILEVYKEPTKFDFKPLDHVELAAKLDLIDFDRATKVTGAKFYYYKNELALLEFALIQYALEVLLKKGYTPFVTHDLAKREVLEGLGYNPRGESTQIYNIEDSDLSLIGTAEITMGAYHKDEVLEASELPKKYVAVSHCFRTEAGAYSKFSKGTYRVHQFTKIEMFVFCKPADSQKYHKELLNLEKKIWKGLDVPFRVIDHCTADLGGPSYRTFDLEAWMPGKPNKQGTQGDWAEVTSTSNCTDYQARGLNIKYRDEAGQKQYAHMLNGTAIAISRAPIVILENNQQADGSITIPKVLQKYLPGKIKIIKR